MNSAIVAANILQRLSSSQVDSDAQAYFTRVESAGGVIDQSVKSAYTNMVLTMKSLINNGSTTEWDRIKELYFPIHNNNASITPALVKAKYPAGKSANLTNSNFVAGDYTKTGGVKGNGTTKTLTSDMIGDDLNYGDLHFMFGFDDLAIETTSNARVMASGGVSLCLAMTPATRTYSFYAHNAFSLSIGSQFLSNAGIDIINITSLSAGDIYVKGRQVNLSAQTGTRTQPSNTNTLRYFSTGSATYFNGYEWFWSIGQSFNITNMKAIYSAFRSVLTALGRTYTDVIVEGDSLSTRGFNIPYPNRAVVDLAGNYSLVSLAIAGQTVATMLANSATKYPTVMDSNTIYVLLAGINDILPGSPRSASAIFADQMALVDYVQSLGVTKVIVGTITDSSAFDATRQTIRSDVNTLIRNNAVGEGYKVMDLAAGTLGTYNATDWSDATHWKESGAQIAADVLKTTIQNAGW